MLGRAWFAWVVVAWGFLCPTVSHAQAFDPLEEAEEAAKELLPADQAEIDERLRKLEAKQGKKKARVVVLKWPDTDMGHDNLLLKAMVKNRAGRPNAKFHPSVDLYQEGRRRRYEGGMPVPPMQQPGAVSDALLDEVRARVDAARRQLGGSTSDRAVAGRLLRLVDEVWFNDREATREVLFDLYVTIGQAMYNPREQTPPYFQMIGAEYSNYYLYLAAAMLWEEREAEVDVLSARKPSGDVGRFIDDLVQLIDDGIHPPIPVAFHDAGRFDATAFAKEYRVVINGVERVVDDTGVVMVPRGRIDLFLERSDGFGLSERVEVVRLDEKIYFAFETAKQKMGYDLLNQLMVHPEECAPYLRPDTRASLATYAALHPRDEVYLAIPKLGTVQELYVWRYERATGDLRLLTDVNRGFPVRFALLAGAGMGFNGASIDTSVVDQVGSVQPDEIQGGGLGDALNLDPQSLLQLDAASVPIDFQLRAHFNRLMVGFGIQFSRNIVADADGQWRDLYQTDGNPVYSADGGDDGADPLDPGADSALVPAFKERDWSRLIYGQIGVFLLKKAPYGIGPRGFLRFGWTNVPHALDLTAHIGGTAEPTFGKKEIKGRVTPLLDADFYAGMIVPFGDTLLRKDTPNANGKYPPQILPQLGFSVGAGFTF